MGADALVRLDDPLIQHFREHDVAVEQARPRLSGDPEGITKAARDHQQGAFTLAFQQCVGGDRGAHLHARDLLRRDRLAGRKLKQSTYALDSGIVVVGGVFRQQLEGMQRLVGRASDDIRERAAPIDPELPLAHDSTALSVSTRPRVSGIANADTMTRAWAATGNPAMASPSGKRVLSTPINDGQRPRMRRPT